MPLPDDFPEIIIDDRIPPNVLIVTSDTDAVVIDTKPKRRCWTIEVCKTCGRRAEWPFCEHKTDDGSWFDLVTVQEVGRRG